MNDVCFPKRLDSGESRNDVKCQQNLDIAFPNVDDWDLKVYASWQHNDAVKSLRYLEVSQVSYNADTQIDRDIRRFCSVLSSTVTWGLARGNDHRDTVLTLVSKDGDFAELLYEADQAGADVYLWTPPGCSNNLQEAVRRDHIIPWNHPCIAVSEDNLSRLKG